MKLDMASSDVRIAGLAQELQDMILDHTLIATAQASELPDIAVGTGTGYRPPWQNRLDSRSRKEFTKWYYKNNIFRKQNSRKEACRLSSSSPSLHGIGRQA